MQSVGTWWMWTGFFGFVLVMILLDLFAFGGRRAHRVSMREAAGWSLVWIAVAALFGGLLWFWLDAEQGREIANARTLEYATGYLMEKALAVDNVFVWLMLFSAFAVPAEYQRRVLIYGVFGAIVMRTGMILAGAWLIERFHWLLYLFGAFLLFTGVRMLLGSAHESRIEDNRVLRWMRGHLRITEQLQGERFLVVRDGLRWLTPLAVVLLLVEVSDLIFAVDSVPAIFAITTDPFIVLTSNIFAILGLRAMYFLLAGVADRFWLLKYGLAVVLMFVGIKMLIVEWFKIPTLVSLAVVAALVAGSMLLSLKLTPPVKEPTPVG